MELALTDILNGKYKLTFSLNTIRILMSLGGSNQFRL